MRRLKVSRWTRFKSSDNSVLNSYAISAAIHWKMRSSLRRIGCLDPAFACFQPSIAIVILIATRCYESQTVLRDEADTRATWWISYVTKPYDARSKGRDHTKECSSPPLSRRLRVLRGFLPPMWRFFFLFTWKGTCWFAVGLTLLCSRYFPECERLYIFEVIIRSFSYFPILKKMSRWCVLDDYRLNSNIQNHRNKETFFKFIHSHITSELQQTLGTFHSFYRFRAPLSL